MTEPAQSNAGRNPTFARILVIYTGIRVILFAVVALALLLVAMNPVVRIAIALVVSGLLSYPLARRQRTELAEALEQRRRTKRR